VVIHAQASHGIIAKALKDRRDNVVLATKAHIPIGAAFEALKPMIGGTRNSTHVRAHWDEILRLATSIKQGTVTASLMLLKGLPLRRDSAAWKCSPMPRAQSWFPGL
jgi:TnpA family transposase